MYNEVCHRQTSLPIIKNSIAVENKIMEVSDKRKMTSSSWFCLKKSTSISSSWSSSKLSSPEKELEEEHNIVVSDSNTNQRKPAGWRGMPYILGNETFESLASFGLAANLMMYLMREYHMEQVNAAVILNVSNGVSNFVTVIGAFISDAYIGKFLTIAFASFATLVGMIIVTLTAVVPQPRPPPCTQEQQQHEQCLAPTKTHVGIFLLGLCCLAIGAAGIRPCSIPFAVDQFDLTTNEGRKETNSFFNWYYTSFTIVLLISSTIVIYVQNEVSWTWGFLIPTLCMVCAIILFFIGTKIYIYVKPEGSIFTSIAQVFVAAYKKRRLMLPTDEEIDGTNTYDPPFKGTVVSKLPLTNQFRFLNKAAIILDNELKRDGSCMNQWSLCSIQQIEEVKCLLNIIPIWASGIIAFLSMQQVGIMIKQASNMDRHLGPKFQIPPGSVAVIALLIIGIFLPICDRLLVPTLEKFTKRDGGITLLQRKGFGNIFGILAMLASELLERKRRALAIKHASPDGVAPMSVMWQAPQYILMGSFEVFNLLGYIEFPDHMRSLGNSLVLLTVAMSNYLSSLVVTIVQHVTGRHGRPNWLTDDANASRVDYFFFLIAGLGALNFIFFVLAAHPYGYKASIKKNLKHTTMM